MGLANPGGAKMIQPNEIQLCAELARCMLRDIIVHQSPDGPDPSRFVKGARFEHGFQGDLENASLVSNCLRLTRCVEEDGSLRMSVGPCYLNELAVEPGEFEDFIQTSLDELGVDMEDVLEGFVAVTVAYRCFLPAARAPFDAPDDHRAALNLLVLHGYAERAGGQFRWTDRIGPAMRDCFMWNDAFEHQATIWEAELIEEARAACASMPDLVRARLKRVADDASEVDFVRTVARHWDGKGWHVQPLSPPTNGSFLPSRFMDFARDIRALLVNAG